MKYHLLINIFLLFFFFSCTKKRAVVKQTPVIEQAPVDEQEAEKKDDIVFRNIDPDIILNTVTGHSYHPGGFTIELPIDTASKDSLKVGDFPLFTFTVAARNFYVKRNIGFNLYANYNLYIRVDPSASSDSILKSGEPYHDLNAQFFSDGAIIGPGQSGRKSPSAYVRATGAYFSGSNVAIVFSEGEHYLGFKKTRGNVINFGWIKVESFGPNGIKVKEIAINKMHNKPIRAGQKE